LEIPWSREFGGVGGLLVAEAGLGGSCSPTPGEVVKLNVFEVEEFGFVWREPS
jgi:hypothetical protein